MTHGVIRGFLGPCRAPILALLAGVGFFMPVVAAGVPAGPGDETVRSWADAPASLVGPTLVRGAVAEPVPGRSGPSGAGMARRGDPSGSCMLPLRRPSPAAMGGHDGGALARLARAGRLSAPTTAPPSAPS